MNTWWLKTARSLLSSTLAGDATPKELEELDYIAAQLELFIKRVEDRNKEKND